MAEEKTYKIYKYTFPDGKIYIGMTSLSLEQRRDDGYNHNKPLKQALRQCGWQNLAKEILCDGLTKEQACELEKKIIAEMNATDSSVGYNVSFGGKETFAHLKHTEDHKRRMSEMYQGRVFSEQHMQHLKEAHSKERIAVESVDSQGKVIKRYRSLGDAADDIRGHKSNISRACKSGKAYKAVYWQYAESEVMER